MSIKINLKVSKNRILNDKINYIIRCKKRPVEFPIILGYN